MTGLISQISAKDELDDNALNLLLKHEHSADIANGKVTIKPAAIISGGIPILAPEETSQSNKEGIEVLPIHNGHGHWVMAVTNHDTKEILCFDPKGNFPATLGLLANGGEGLDENRLKNLIVAVDSDSYTVTDTCIRRDTMPGINEGNFEVVSEGMVQKDSDSINCGAYCARFSKLVTMKGCFSQEQRNQSGALKDITDTLANINIEGYRKEMHHELETEKSSQATRPASPSGISETYIFDKTPPVEPQTEKISIEEQNNLNLAIALSLSEAEKIVAEMNVKDPIYAGIGIEYQHCKDGGLMVAEMHQTSEQRFFNHDVFGDQEFKKGDVITHIETYKDGRLDFHAIESLTDEEISFAFNADDIVAFKTSDGNAYSCNNSIDRQTAIAAIADEKKNSSYSETLQNSSEMETQNSTPLDQLQNTKPSGTVFSI